MQKNFTQYCARFGAGVAVLPTIAAALVVGVCCTPVNLLVFAGVLALKKQKGNAKGDRLFTLKEAAWISTFPSVPAMGIMRKAERLAKFAAGNEKPVNTVFAFKRSAK